MLDTILNSHRLHPHVHPPLQPMPHHIKRHYTASQKIKGTGDEIHAFLNQKVWVLTRFLFNPYYLLNTQSLPKNCGVFGVSSEEYLNYAEKNRHEWEARGEEIVAELVEKAKFLEGNNSDNKLLRRDSVL
jgi:hypothetical protein